ncbi:alpha/beta hydrolase fold domain-containing protein [Saccharopolyspora griseoalba]|uniref:Alpha/beta hydrolase fold domain-containing protein n=1 Tax=Saccharopolyspora griseoalba TaxID=1431848 RepID=A0ABW2LPV0_9PSEU
MVRRVVAAGLVLVALVATGCSPRSEAEAPAPADPELGAHQVMRQQVFARRDSGALRLDLFLPEGDRPAPLVVYVHGGGWNAGERTLRPGTPEGATARRLLAEGYAVATVDYRLSGVARHPAQLLDVAEAVRWLQANAANFGLDSGRLALWGASAGGHLVSQLGAVAGDPEQPGGGLTGVRAVLNWFGPTDVSAEAQQAHPEMRPYARAAVTELLGCQPVVCPERAASASPVRHLSGDEPPFLIQQGTADSLVPLDGPLDFAARSRALGVPVELHPYEGLDHGFAGTDDTSSITRTLVDYVRARV